ncbi:branched-chain amino acid aminotransferase [Streptococcus pneumoniae 2009]|nr:branched-chain amino acid aminotransferase [Streptococcus pneumoniae 2009]
MTVTIDWENLGFSYMKLPYRYLAHFKNGQWDQGELTEDATLHISESSPSLHYGQQAFEGLKAYRTKDGSVQLFRPDENAKRLQRTCDRLLMPQVPTDMFVEACKAVVRANEEYVPPYGIGGTLYLRPLLIGVGDIIGVKPAEEYIFTIFAMPVGNYFKGGLVPTNFLIQDEYDRAAPNGTGAAKLVETMLQVSYQEKWPSHAISQMLSIWTHQLIQRLKKSDQLISLELQLIMNL